MAAFKTLLYIGQGLERRLLKGSFFLLKKLKLLDQVVVFGSNSTNKAFQKERQQTTLKCTGRLVFKN